MIRCELPPMLICEFCNKQIPKVSSHLIKSVGEMWLCHIVYKNICFGITSWEKHYCGPLRNKNAQEEYLEQLGITLC